MRGSLILRATIRKGGLIGTRLERKKGRPARSGEVVGCDLEYIYAVETHLKVHQT